MNRKRTCGGLGLVAAWVVACLTPAAAEIPGDLETRVQVNETAAITTLRAILTAEVRFQVGAHVDENGDAFGEFGTLAELSGAKALRGRMARLEPTLLPPAFRLIHDDGTYRRAGFRFRVSLPGPDGVALREAAGGGLAAGRADAQLAATWFLVYAWPEANGRTGRRTFVVSRTGDVFATRKSYSGNREPEADAALRPPVASPVSILGDPVPGERASDGLRWDAFQPVLDCDEPDEGRLSQQHRFANSVAAIATLRNVCAAQAQFQAAAIVDVDNDGTGEFGTFGEMSGAVPVRGSKSRIQPPVLSEAFRKLSPDGSVRRFGYRFAIHLPGPKGHGTRERPDGTSDARPDPDLTEAGWIGYAWPEKLGRRGNLTFVVLSSGDILAVNTARYSGDSGPAPSAAMPPGKATATTMDRPVATDGAAGDGSRWKLEP